MKKGLLGFLLVAVAMVTFGISSFAAGTGNLVVHFQAWDGDYSAIGNHGWNGTSVNSTYSGLDDFGAYFEFNDIAIEADVAMGFIAVEFVDDGNGGLTQNWDNKYTGDVLISKNDLVENETVHVYVFEGSMGEYYVADNTTWNALIVYYDPAGAYEETLGVHNWGWTENASAWATPLELFTDGGKSEAGFAVKVGMLAAVEDWAGLLIYAGDDATKHTGDLNDTNVMTDKTPGAVNVAYVVNGGAGLTDNSNVFTTADAFREAAFTFKLLPLNAEDMSGTYAVDPTTVVVKTSSAVESPYPLAEDKDAAKAMIESWFAVREVLGEGSYGDPLAIDRVDFAQSNTTLNTFIIILSDALDNTKDYEVFFNTSATAEQMVEVTLNVEVPANTPADAVISLGASFGGWNPEDAAWAATKVDDTHYTITFNVSVTGGYAEFEYKWTQGSWSIGENLAEGNRKFALNAMHSSVTFDDVITAWDNDTDAADTKYPATIRDDVFKPTLADASLGVDMDRNAPALTFISPLSFIGADAESRIIEVPWGAPFDDTLFPRFAVADDRDGDVTSFVFVPKGAYSVLDTRTEGDYTIMLQVTDEWGNVTQETFIFRVTKG